MSGDVIARFLLTTTRKFGQANRIRSGRRLLARMLIEPRLHWLITLIDLLIWIFWRRP
jgi:hypothetical protein